MQVPITDPERARAVFHARMESPGVDGSRQYDPSNFMSASKRAAEVLLGLLSEGYPREPTLKVCNAIINAALRAEYCANHPEETIRRVLVV